MPTPALPRRYLSPDEIAWLIRRGVFLIPIRKVAR